MEHLRDGEVVHFLPHVHFISLFILRWLLSTQVKMLNVWLEISVRILGEQPRMQIHVIGRLETR